MNYDNLSRDDLIAMIESLQQDSAFNIINRNGAMLKHSNIPDDKSVIMVDICNMHALNHMYTMNGVDDMIKSVIGYFRHSDIIIRWGGDELVIILNSGNALEYVDRFDRCMRQHNMYAVYAIVSSKDGLLNTVIKADELVMQVKYNLELNHMKPARDQEYALLDSHVVSE